MMEKPELSKKSKYWIPRHRYYELKHFCLQYPLWKKHLAIISDWPNCIPEELRVKHHTPQRPTETIIFKKMQLKTNMDMVETVANQVDPVIGPYIFRGVTEGRTYENLRTNFNIPCNRSEYYEMYREFFYLLSEARQ